MKNDQITTKESAYLIYAYVSISSFVLMSISKVTDSLEKALNFNPILCLLIILNMIVFISLHIYRRNHTISHK
ncbi:hypothetical protein [Flavobacterium sp. 5]|uniref:hypothetical protein n=1 Tax=Flavobacterium sp. 5 TaxID=2035199 RepID=UPI000CB1623E|nr:hypothetical protein [Flavobacterium sp. 5]PKB16712.1 hypothetical protein CLU82_1857 [Flavobacterium sp. 5]